MRIEVKHSSVPTTLTLKELLDKKPEGVYVNETFPTDVLLIMGGVVVNIDGLAGRLLLEKHLAVFPDHRYTRVTTPITPEITP